VDPRLARVQSLIDAEPADPNGMVGALRRLCGAAVRAVPASGAGLSVMTDGGVRGLAAASDGSSERIDELEFALGEGPCLEAFVSRRPVLEPDLADGGMSRWPLYAAAAYNEGLRAAFAFPLQIGAARLGVLDLHRREPGPLSAEELTQALSFADVATTLLLNAQKEAPPGAAADGLDEAMASHYQLHQAQGMVMVQVGVSLAAALALLRAYAYSHDCHLDDVARDVVTRSLRLDEDPPEDC
jgi:GAF domain-containing protein